MHNIPARTVFSEITDFLATSPTPQDIIDYTLPEHLVVRSKDLMERNGEGELNAEERDELLDFVRVDEMMSLLKAKMKQHSSNKVFVGESD